MPDDSRRSRRPIGKALPDDDAAIARAARVTPDDVAIMLDSAPAPILPFLDPPGAPEWMERLGLPSDFFAT